MHPTPETPTPPAGGPGVEAPTGSLAGRAVVEARDPRPVTGHQGSSVLELEGVTMVFGGLVAVDRLDLTLRPGELVGLIGPNGAGKTTVFNMITGHYTPTSGRIRFLGQEITGLPPNRITAMGIARTFQNVRLFGGMTVLENVLVSHHGRLRSSVWGALLRLPRYNREEQAMQEEGMDLLRQVGLEHLAHVEAGSLPYGQQRRLEIARALATRPRLLLLDEPAAGMNPEETRGLMTFIRAIRDRFGLTILLIEHDMKLVMGICERIRVLDHGQSIAEGGPADIQAHPRVIQAYLGEEDA